MSRYGFHSQEFVSKAYSLRSDLVVSSKVPVLLWLETCRERKHNVWFVVITMRVRWERVIMGEAVGRGGESESESEDMGLDVGVDEGEGKSGGEVCS